MKFIVVFLIGTIVCVHTSAQEIPKSGILGVDLVFASSPSGQSQLYAFAPNLATGLAPVGSSVNNVPSRWAHRRRTLGALETEIRFVAVDGSGIAVCPMGDTIGTGAIFLADFRLGTATSMQATGNPAAYDLTVVESQKLLFLVEDGGANNSILRGFSYATPGQLIPTTPPTLSIVGSPAAYCHQIGVDQDTLALHVPTTQGIQVVHVNANVPNLTPGAFVSTLPHSPTTNPQSVFHNGIRTWIIGMSEFDSAGKPTGAGTTCWDSSGNEQSNAWGTIPGLFPPRSYVPAAGCHELAVVSDGTDSYVYYLLRDPSPTAFFIRPSAIGVVRLLNGQPPTHSLIFCPDDMGEPFAIPTVHGTRVALESSFGPPFIHEPAGGGEKISILYSPLDPLGASSDNGILGVPDPLGGRISTKGVDRPFWTRSGDRVVSCTSYFPGAPNPGTPGIEVLNVSPTIPLDEFISPHQVVPYVLEPNRSIIFPNRFEPRVPGAASFLNGLSVVGNVFHDGMASILVTPFGEIGIFQPDAVPFVQDADIPNFPGVFPASFNYTKGAALPPPSDFGARRTTFNTVPGYGLNGLVMLAAINDVIHIQLTGYNFLAAIGWNQGPSLPVTMPLPTGWVTTSEFVSI